VSKRDGQGPAAQRATPSHAEIVSALAEYGYAVNAEMARKIRVYVSLLERWNSKMALTTVRDSAEVLRVHFGESLFALRVAGPLAGLLADVGSGAGFPAMPLKLACSELQVRLYESNRKKAAFLQEVIWALGLERVEVLTDRVGKKQAPAAFGDVITARAVGEHETVVRWARSALRAGGRVLLWVTGGDAEMVRGMPGWQWQRPEKIPGTRERVILVGTKSE
jgi:16S rRNA (guanine527-N7)-methyltransferase